MTQRTFTFTERERYAEKVDRLLAILSDGRWYKAKELARLLLTDDRTVRKYSDLSGGRVISGDKGYKLTRWATIEEVRHAEARLLSQARRMQERAVEIRRESNRGAAA